MSREIGFGKRQGVQVGERLGLEVFAVAIGHLAVQGRIGKVDSAVSVVAHPTLGGAKGVPDGACKALVEGKMGPIQKLPAGTSTISSSGPLAASSTIGGWASAPFGGPSVTAVDADGPAVGVDGVTTTSVRGSTRAGVAGF